MKKLILIIVTLFSLNGVAQKPESIKSYEQVYIVGEGDDKRVFAVDNSSVYIIFRFKEKIIERYDSGTGDSRLTYISEVEQIRDNIWQYSGIDEAKTPIVIQV
mgnify:CR=1 FL=1